MTTVRGVELNVREAGDGRPVAARGMLLAASLLRGPGSPLYSDGPDVLLPRALTRVLGALEP